MKTYRLPPCLFYDIEHMENWLEEMASKGLFLKKIGRFASFVKKEPQQVRYRLEPLPKKFSIFSHQHVDPLDETIAFNESAGWHFVTKYFYFAIYMTEDINAPELHTDPEVQALTYDRIIKKLKRDAFIMLVLLALLFYVIIKAGTAKFFMEMSNYYLISFSLLLIVGIIDAFLQFKFIYQIRKQLQENQPLKHSKSIHQLSKFYYFLNWASLLAIIAVNIYYFSVFSDPIENNDEIPLSEYQEIIPFNTLDDLIDSKSNEIPEGFIKNTTNLFANRRIDYYETLSSSDYHLEIKYYDCKIEKMAMTLAKNLYDIDYRWYKEWSEFEIMDTNKLPEGTIYHYKCGNGREKNHFS